MNDSIKHSDDEVVCTVTYTWGQVKTFLKEHGGCATDSNAEALLAECGNGSIDTGKDNLFCDAYDEIEQCLYTSLTTASLPDKPWYDRPNGEWVYDREEPADHHDADEDEAWYGTYCHVGIHGGNQCRCCNTCSQCGRHMCEACTVRCSTCGSIVCNNDASETKDGEWECVECDREHDPEKSRLLDALENYQGTIRSEKAENERRIIIPSANLAGTTIPTGVEVIGLGRIDELLNQGRPMRKTPWRTTGTSGGPPPLPIGLIHGRRAWIEPTHAKMVLNMVQIPDKEIVMFNSLDVLDDLVPVSELSNGRTSAVLNKADRAPVIIIKRNKPSYVLMGINDYQDLLDRLEDTEDARLAEKRIEDNNGRATIPNADLMAELGLTEEDIAGTPTPEMA